MRQVFKSDILNKEFDSEKECLKAEKEYQKELEEKENKKNLVSKEKKELADKIEIAEKALEEANKEYELAQDKAAEILEKSNKEVKQILELAKDKVRTAQREKRDAIIAFNNKFGVYTTQYTGEKAIEEFNKAMDKFYSPLLDIFKDFWF